MTTSFKLSELAALHSQLVAVSKAGIAIELEDGMDSKPIAERLEVIYSKVAVRIANGESIDQILADDTRLPNRYRTALNLWLRCDSSPQALEAMCNDTRGNQVFSRVANQSWLSTGIVAVLVYCGLIYLLMTLIPKEEAMYLQAGTVPGVGLSVLLWLKRTLFIWVIAVPVIGACMAIGIRRLWNRSQLSKHPLGARFIDASRRAISADNISELAERGFSIDQASQWGTLDSGVLKRKTIDKPNAVATGSSDDGRLMSWAIAQCRVGQSNERNLSKRTVPLRFVAKVDRYMAVHRGLRTRRILPVVAGTIVGGLLVFGYAIGLFYPLIELLVSITQAESFI
jgi:hypothetical protein